MTTTGDPSPPAADDPAPVAPVATTVEPARVGALHPLDRWVPALAGILAVALMVVSGRYGFHRDELYFLDCGRHLAGGYVDQPVLTPLLARITLEVAGVSVVALRAWSALAAAGTVVLSGLAARELGGGRTAQRLGALGAATMPVLLGTDHLFGPTAFDLLCWPALALVVLRIDRTGDRRLWVVAGLVLGVGLTNKDTVGFLAAALLVGVVAAGGWRTVANRWFIAGAAVALAFTVPDLWWQATHHWPTVAMDSALHRENGGAHNIPTFVVDQLLNTNLVLVWVWVAGLFALWRSGRPLRRALVWAYGLLFVLFALTAGAKAYYLAGAYLYLLPAGAAHLEPWFEERRVRWHRLVVATVLSLALILPVTLPILPATDARYTYGLNQVPGESVGWPGLVATVDGVWRSLPPEQRARAVVFTLDYGEAGAINELGRGTGLPVAVSGHNNEWYWGPGNPRATTVVVVAPGPLDVQDEAATLRGLFVTVRTAATLTNPDDLHNQEWGGHVYVCTGPRRPWGQLWPSLRHDD